MLGGYQIIDLRKLDLTHGTSAVSITDAEILNQLRNIRNHIQKDYNFARPLDNQLKPVLIRYRDKKSGEKHEVAVFGNLEVLTNYYTFKAVAENNGEKITIDIVFEEKTDEYDNKYWDIKTAKVLLSTAQAIYEEITDKDGHKRFVEGNGISIEKTGVTITYNKWSLSGSHLMFVVAGNVANETALTSGSVFAEYELPKWILDKIYPVFGGDTLEVKKFDLTDNGWQTQNVNCALIKSIAQNKMQIHITSNVTLDSDKGFRISYDLLIDNESQD